MIRHWSGLAGAFATCLIWAVLVAPDRAQPDSPPSGSLAARGEGLVLARCAVCHSPDLIRQQRLSRDTWDATVTKMRHWGAELSDDEALILVDYLSGRYSSDAPEVLPPVMGSANAAVPFRIEGEQKTTGERPEGNARRGAGIFFANCQACHGLKAIGGVGPKLAQNPILNEDDRFWDTVLHGRGAMPPWGAVLKPQEIADIHAWLQSLHQ
ncbi:hypothetical protein YTPLAS18_36700 [Nitrospira sp.]|nr:hypothetical protein YTPLAS18_36700 [Nitrospira sp.]